MKTIFRYTNIAALMVAIIMLGTVSGFAQDPAPKPADPCADAEGQTTLGDKFRTQFPDKSIPGRTSAIETGKQFLEKYGACDSAKELADYLKAQMPKMEKGLQDAKDKDVKDKLISRFNAGLTAKNWDEVYAAGKELLVKYPDEFRAVELVLGSIGYDEMFAGNTKWSDETLKFSKQSLADLQSGKDFKPGFGVKPFSYNSKDDATAWMNLTIGSIYQIAKKDKAAALPYLYAATQATGSDVTKNPNPYDFIGSYYFDQVNKLVEQIKTKVADQKETDTPEIAKTKVDEIKGLVAMLNGTAERAMDAYARAYTLGVKADYKAKMKKNIQDAYKVRFAKETGVDEWIAATMKTSFANPTTPIAPISDPEPGAPASTTTTTTTTAPPIKPVPPATKPPTTAPVKPASTTTTKPAATTKPQARVKKPVAKKKSA